MSHSRSIIVVGILHTMEVKHAFLSGLFNFLLPIADRQVNLCHSTSWLYIVKEKDMQDGCGGEPLSFPTVQRLG